MRVGLNARSDFLPEHPTQQRSTTGVNAHDFPAPINLGNLDLVGDHDATAHQVDEVSRQEIFGEETSRRAVARTSKVDPTALEGHATLG